MEIASACFNKAVTHCFLALGSNLGDRQANLLGAISELSRREVEITNGSSVYSTEPLGLSVQPWFLNTIVEAVTDISPEALMGICLEVETKYHRSRLVPNGPRTIDIDIIFFGDQVVRSESLMIPHPRYRDRRFVLEPLLEIAADFIDPVLNQPISEIFARVRDCSEVKRVGPPLA